MLGKINKFKKVNTTYYWGLNVKIDEINSFLELIKNEFHKIIIKYIWTAQTINQDCLFAETIFDEEDFELSREITSIEDWRKYSINYLEFLEESTNEIIYFSDEDVKIKCIR